ncbi:hypothetical protein [Limosilactobacillus antri]|uniref:hypothetical protein n=2 Tax=Limosilactobacillus antri TaxID=227943 RepID=UPI001F578D95|nr:hypothetical protein [Limosilactobacillus antri]
MNKELKIMFKIGFSLLALLLIIINGHSWIAHKRTLPGTDSSFQVAVNRLRHPQLNHPSELARYPRLKGQPALYLVAIRKERRLYVISGHQVLYIVNARINLSPATLHINHSRGNQIFNQNNNVQQVGTNWLSLSQADTFIEAPVEVNNHRVHGNWLQARYHCANTIDVSKPDAYWLQDLPAGTRLVIK